jgi:hypothetical protein
LRYISAANLKGKPISKKKSSFKESAIPKLSTQDLIKAQLLAFEKPKRPCQIANKQSSIYFDGSYNL